MRARVAVTGPLAATLSDLDLRPNHAVLQTPERVLRASDLDTLAGQATTFAGQRVALCLTDPFDMVCAVLALDGRAEALMLLAPDLPAEQAAVLIAGERISKVISDRADLADATGWSDLHPVEGSDNGPDKETQWLLTTSGTTGTPKLVRHSRHSILRTVRRSREGKKTRWALLYDPSRFAGTQVLAQAVLSGATLLVPDPAMGMSASVEWLAHQGCTHISATPSLWRHILMTPASAGLPLRQATLGGEIADQVILDALRVRYPDARITHVYASTEIGVGFSVQDGQAGFPAAWLTEKRGRTGEQEAHIRVRDDLLWLKPPGASPPEGAHIECDADGYCLTHDRMERIGDRFFFRGREDFSVNVGGVKVQIEAVEDVVHRHPAVAQCRIIARPSPLLGNILTLAVVPQAGDHDKAALRKDIASWCRQHLPRSAQPAMIRIVAELALTRAGKLERAR